ncbi:N-acyl homoserine lactonase [Serratia marcescens]
MKKFSALIAIFVIFTLSFNANSIVTPGGTASDLTKQYYNTSKDCGSDNKPAFLCSGVLLRGTIPSVSYHSWEPSPSSMLSGGVSFSYLRADSKFKKLAYGYNNGLIFLPHNKIPQGKIESEVLCSFPIDADSFNRGENGCGSHNKYPSISKACQSMRILTAGAWKNHYTQSSFEPHLRQCGFNIREGVDNNAFYFYESIRARSLITSEAFAEQNELRLATWKQGIGAKLPIQAFFYIKDGLRNAQYDQRDYYNNTGIFIPIVKITLPDRVSENAKFNFIHSDQVINP